MATRPKATETDNVQDAEHVFKQATSKAMQKEFASADKGRKKKLFPTGFFVEFGATLKAARGAKGAQSTRKSSVKTATQSEIDARAALFDTLTDVRDTIKNAYEDKASAPLRQAFGVGFTLNKKSTPNLLDGAGRVLDALQDDDHAAKAKAAGVQPKMIRVITRQRDDLASADSSQSEKLAARSVGTGAKNNLLKKLTKSKAHVRSVAKLIFKKRPELLMVFAPTIVRRTPKKRAPKSAVAAATVTK